VDVPIEGYATGQHLAATGARIVKAMKVVDPAHGINIHFHHLRRTAVYQRPARLITCMSAGGLWPALVAVSRSACKRKISRVWSAAIYD
jgi:hypothetical protein